jgi:hypothetical protein
MTEPTSATPPPDDAGSPAPPKPRPATIGQVVGAVLWSFFGVRKGDAMRRDAVALKPHQVIIVGIVFAAIFVVTLLIIVRVITHNA